MLVSSVARYQAEGQRVTDRYAAWSAALRQLRNDWDSGTRVQPSQLHAYLQQLPADQHREALQDLIAAHLQLSWQVGCGEKLDAYLSQVSAEFAEIASSDSVPAELIEDEFLARYQTPHGDMPTLDEYQQRLAARPDVLKLLRARCLDDGRYVKLSSLGRGAMGEVWRAYDRHLGRLVAIKQPIAGAANRMESLRRFAHEARVTAELEHPAIVSVHEYSSGSEARRMDTPARLGHDTQQSPFYVMRLVEGPTLSEVIRAYYALPTDQPAADKRLRWQELLQSFVAICDAIAYVHSKGVLHRDLKPGNIVIETFAAATILDWGMASRLDADSDLNPATVAGTPEYMPPEQLDGIADTRSDVFGLGSILYEVLACRSPRVWADGARPADWRDVVRHAGVLPARHYRPQTPAALDAISRKALSKEPDKRYESATALGDDVRRYLCGERVSAWREPLWYRAWRWWNA